MHKNLIILFLVLISGCGESFDIISDCGTQITQSEISKNYFTLDIINNLENQVIQEWSNLSIEIFEKEVSKDDICNSLYGVNVQFVNDDFVWYREQPAKGFAFMVGNAFVASKEKNEDKVYSYIYKVYCHEISHLIFWNLGFLGDHHKYLFNMTSCSEEVI